MTGKDRSRLSDWVAHRRTFADVFEHTLIFCAALVGAPACLIVLVVGGDDLLDAGTLVATGIAIPVTALGVSWFRYQRGATGFPRRQPVQPGDRVGEWLVLNRLQNEVSSDSTYLVRNHDDYGVLKVSYHRADDEDARRRAAREAEYLDLVLGVRHVVAKLDDATTPTATYLVTRYLGQQTLWDRRQAGPVPDAELYSIAAGSLTGLSSLHEAGIAHLDLTPLNIVVSAEGAATIIDLGIARADATTQMTTTRPRIFTVGYRAPEQFAGEAGPQSDVFVWGATIYYLATGVQAFTGDEAQVQDRIRSATPDLSICPSWLQPTLRASFNRDPDHRLSATELLVLLQGANQARWPVLIPTSPTPPRTTRVPSWVSPSVILTAMVLALLSAFLSYQKAEMTDAAAGPGANPSSTTIDDGSTSQPTSTEPDTTTSSTSSTSTTSTLPPAGPTTEFVGVWHGGSVGSDGEVPVVFNIDNPAAKNEGDPVGGWTYLNCSGPLRLVSVAATVLVLTPAETQPDCGFGGRATLTRSGDSAAYDWKSDDGASRSGTFVRSARITAENPGWPTELNEAGNAFYANLGVCMTGGSGCSKSGQTPTWTACTTDELCIAGGDASVVDVWRNLSWVLEIPSSVPNTAIALLGVGFTESQVVDLLDL